MMPVSSPSERFDFFSAMGKEKNVLRWRKGERIDELAGLISMGNDSNSLKSIKQRNLISFVQDQIRLEILPSSENNQQTIILIKMFTEYEIKMKN